MDGHSHGHAHGLLSERTPLRPTLLLLIPAGLLVALAMFLLWPPPAPAADPSDVSERITGTVQSVRQVSCPPLDEPSPTLDRPEVCGTVEVRLADGPDAGSTVSVAVPSGPGAPQVRVDEQVVLMYLPDSFTGGNPYQIVDHDRSDMLWITGLVFVLAVVAFGRWRGLASLAGLAVTFVVLLTFIVPAILGGRPPMLVAIVGAAAIMLTVLYLTHGFTLTTSVAVAGTLASLTLTAVLAAAATSLTHLTGVVDDQTSYLTMAFGDVNMAGLLLAGIVIGALGVLDDVTVTQAATVSEIAAADPGLSRRGLYRAATRVGRAHIASVVNTMILAYAGASLPLLLLLTASDARLGELVTEQLIAQEIVRSVVGTLGLIAAVPITTALATYIACRKTAGRRPAHGGADGPGDPVGRQGRRRAGDDERADDVLEALGRRQ
jgi:uncharacterized membrane protein